MHILVAFFAIFLFFVPSLYAIEFDDYDSLTSHIVKAADNGDAKARYYLVINYLDGKNGFKKNVAESYRWAKMLAENGDSEIQYLLATNNALKPYVENRGKDQIFWLEQASNAKHPLAMEKYGEYLYKKEDYSKAVPILMDAVMEGHSIKSVFYLGYCFKFGLGIKQDLKQSAEQFNLFIKLSESLNGMGKAELIDSEMVVAAYYETSQNYMTGEGVDSDLQLAFQNIEKALSKTSSNRGSRNYTLLCDLKGSILLLLGKNSEAKRIWEEIVVMDPSYPSESTTFFCASMTDNVDFLIPSSNINNNKTFAIVIANENYKRVPNVPFAHNDGNIFRKYLISSFGVPEENIEYFEDASLNDIKYALANVSQRCTAFRDQVSVIVYYAGHGVPDDKTAEAFLLPVDGFGTDPSSGLNLDDFYASLSEMPAKSIVVLLDACFSGAKRDGGMLMATRGITIKPKIQVPDGKLIVLSATSNDETAFPIEQQKHGLFTYTLLRKIQETGGDITWGELADYVTATVKNRSIDINGKLQTPTVSVSSSMKDIWRNLKLR